MKYLLINQYNKSAQVRNTYLRILRYVRAWNTKNPDKPILRIEIQEIRDITYPKIKWYKQILYRLIGKY